MAFSFRSDGATYVGKLNKLEDQAMWRHILLIARAENGASREERHNLSLLLRSISRVFFSMSNSKRQWCGSFENLKALRTPPSLHVVSHFSSHHSRVLTAWAPSWTDVCTCENDA